ncbi:hypothetical protein KUCAC02_014009, partial [Chaenocephalus aceratus]
MIVLMWSPERRSPAQLDLHNASIHQLRNRAGEAEYLIPDKGVEDTLSLLTCSREDVEYSFSTRLYRMGTAQNPPEGETASHVNGTHLMSHLQGHDSRVHKKAAPFELLFELLGPEGLEMISTLLQRRAAIVDSLISMPPDRTGYTADVSRLAIGEAKPTFACQVTIQSEQERQMMKLYRREEKRERKRGKGGEEGESSDAALTFDPREMRTQREQALLTARRDPILSRERVYERIRYPNVYDCHAEAAKTPAFVGGAKMMLPEGIRRDNTKMYEEVEIPPNDPMPIGFEEKPVFIAELDEIAQLVFKGMKRLNRIQSLVFETAYNTNENLLICAPTGAGKTNIAMLAVLHVINQHLQPGGVIKKDEFKIVYVAPMKALAAEMTNYFGKRLEPLGITVKELTGDMQLTKGEILRTQMLVTTPEKWDVVTRKSVGDVALSQIVRLLILDEVHLLHEDRGPVLESLVARTIRQTDGEKQAHCRCHHHLPDCMYCTHIIHMSPIVLSETLHWWLEMRHKGRGDTGETEFGENNFKDSGV